MTSVRPKSESNPLDPCDSVGEILEESLFDCICPWATFVTHIQLAM